MKPQQALMSREGSDAHHRAMQDVPVFLPVEPQVGAPLRIWTENGGMVTSNVRHVYQDGSQIVVETVNSRYRLQPS